MTELFGAVKPMRTDKEIARDFTERVGKIEAQEAAELRRLVEELRLDVAHLSGRVGALERDNVPQELAELKMRLIRVEASVTELGLRLSDLATTYLDPTGRRATTGPTDLHPTGPTATTDVERKRALKAEQMRRYRERKKAGETT